jgi:hypothetical protein
MQDIIKKAVQSQVAALSEVPVAPLPLCRPLVLLFFPSALSGFVCDARAQELSGRWDAKMQHLQQRLQSLEAK